MDRYIGLDAHTSSCTVAVVGPSGRRLGSHVVETNAGAVIETIRGIPGPRHLLLEEGTLSDWLYETLSPHVEELVVEAVTESRGPKSDALDAFGLAERLRTGSIATRVFKEKGRFGRLRHLATVHQVVVGDSVRAQVRLKTLLRSRGLVASGRGPFALRERKEWLRRLPEEARFHAELLYREYDALSLLRKEARRELIREARKHRPYAWVRSCPGLGPIRTAELLPVVVTPHRFRSKRAFWSYCGLGIVMRSSSDWVQTREGGWVRAQVRQTRGLSRRFNHTLKRIFKGAAVAVISRGEDEPLYRHYVRLLDGGTKPTLARLTIARQIASIVLAVWRNEEVYNPERLERRI